MKLRVILLAMVLSAVLLAGCNNNSSEDKKTDNSQDDKVAENMEDEGLDTRIYGTWQRTATYTDGKNMGTDPSTTFFREDGTYFSVGTMCGLDGAYIVLDDVINWTINDTDCPGYKGPYDYFSKFKISEDGNGLTIDTQMSGHTVTETFVRGEDGEDTLNS